MRMGEATQKLKGILDGRGVKQYLKGYDHLTYCDFGGHLASIFETSKGKMVLHVTFDRAEDAAEAVIGAGEHQSNRALKDEVAWLNAELHGAELRAERTAELVAEVKEDGRKKSGIKVGWIHCSYCGAHHSGSAVFTADGKFRILRHREDGGYCPHCGSRFTNDIDELSGKMRV